MFTLTYPKSEGCEGAVMHPSLLVFWGYGGGGGGGGGGPSMYVSKGGSQMLVVGGSSPSDVDLSAIALGAPIHT